MGGQSFDRPHLARGAAMDVPANKVPANARILGHVQPAGTGEGGATAIIAGVERRIRYAQDGNAIELGWGDDSVALTLLDAYAPARGEAAARENQVYPMSNGSPLHFFQRDPAEERFATETVLVPETSVINGALSFGSVLSLPMALEAMAQNTSVSPSCPANVDPTSRAHRCFSLVRSLIATTTQALIVWPTMNPASPAMISWV